MLKRFFSLFAERPRAKWARQLPRFRTACFEPLEVRRLLAVDNWTGNAHDGLWMTAGNWDSGVPVAGETVNITISNPGTITISGGAANAGLLNDTTAPLNISSGASLSLTSAGATSTFGQRVTVAGGGTLSVGGGATVTIGAGVPIFDNGTVTFAAGDNVDTGYGFDAADGIVVGSGGVLNASGTTFNAGGYLTVIDITSGGELVAANNTFSFSQLNFYNGAVIKPGDLSENDFKLPISLPLSDVAMLSAATGGSDNRSFDDVDIRSFDGVNTLADTLTSGTLSLNLIGSRPRTCAMCLRET